MIGKIILISLFILSICSLATTTSSTSWLNNYNNVYSKLESNKRIKEFYNSNKDIEIEYIKLKQKQSSSTFEAPSMISNGVQPPVSENCSKSFPSISSISKQSNLELLMYSGIGFNELGNYDGCLSLSANESQYCLYDGHAGSISFYIGVCYPSSNVCSKQDVLSLMTQYSVLGLLQNSMNLSINNLQCYNADYPTDKPKNNVGTGIMTFVCLLILISVLIGTLIDYIIIYKLKLYKDKFKIHDHQSSPLLIIQDEDEENERIVKDELPFYSGLFNRLIGLNIDTDNNKLVKYLLCWSLIKNFNSLVYGSSSKSYFNSLDGIRAISSASVVLGHSVLFCYTFGFGADNLQVLTNSFTKFSFQAVFASEYSVDIFFMISGFLVAYSLIGALDKQKGKSIIDQIKFWFVYVVHRFIRLSPLYYFILFFSMWVLPMMGDGPIYYQFNEANITQCSSVWWRNVLYINNFFRVGCGSIAWYIANDMQFFLITPFLILIFKKSKIVGWLVVVSIMVSSIIGVTVVTFENNIPPFFDVLHMESSDKQAVSSNQLITDTYTKPWYRISPYLIGTLLAFIYTTPSLSDRLRHIYQLRIPRYVLYGVSFSIIFFISYISCTFYKGDTIEDGVSWNIAQSSIFAGFTRPLFVIGLAILLLSLFYGYGGVVKWFLELNIFKFFSKLTYSIYLVHLYVIQYRLYSMTSFMHYSILEFVWLYFGNLAAALISAFVLHLLIEKPFINLERLIFSHK